MKWEIEGKDTITSIKYKYIHYHQNIDTLPSAHPNVPLAIDNYLDLRRRFGENLEQTLMGWNPPKSYLAIRAFNQKS